MILPKEFILLVLANISFIIIGIISFYLFFSKSQKRNLTLNIIVEVLRWLSIIVLSIDVLFQNFLPIYWFLTFIFTLIDVIIYRLYILHYILKERKKYEKSN